MGRLFMIGGPSCVGKTPLHKALDKFYPDIAEKLAKLVLYNSRKPRPHETEGRDYYFRPRVFMERLRAKQGFVVRKVRKDLQALDLNELERALKGQDLIFEGNPFIGKVLLTHPSLKGVKRVSVFISPLSKHEVRMFKKSALSKVVADIMRRKLLRRAFGQEGPSLSKIVLRDIEVRATSAYRELKEAFRYDYVLPNHDGEDSEHWGAFSFPLGDARRTLLALVEILKGRRPAAAERWGKGTI